MDLIKNIQMPKEWNETYLKLCSIFSQYGIEAIKECKALCADRNVHIIDCYNVFNSAVAAYNSGRTREATLIYNYLVGQLNIYYPNFEPVLKTGAFYIFGMPFNDAYDFLDSGDTTIYPYLNNYIVDDNKLDYSENHFELTNFEMKGEHDENMLMIFIPSKTISTLGFAINEEEKGLLKYTSFDEGTVWSGDFSEDIKLSDILRFYIR